MKKAILFAACMCLALVKINAQEIVSPVKTNFDLTKAYIFIDPNDFATVRKAAELLQQDIELVTGKKIPLITASLGDIKGNAIIIGSLGKSSIVNQLVKQKKISATNVKAKWEAYQIQTIKFPTKTISNALIIFGNDRRGTAFGVLELSKQIGVSPWYWWADVPAKTKENIFINANATITDAPKVKYRGIFINDEAPALSNWSKEKFGGFNHLFYAKVFEIMLRLKANYIWPAMWGNAFYDDDSLNMKTADEYGIVIGTSHHEPLMRAHDEWRRHGKGKWNYDSNEIKLKDFWKAGMQRATNEKIVSVGMRGDGDEPMSRETATSLLERIVKDQREIISTVTGKPASATPQLWALYKEVQDYYDKGMRVPDDVTLLLCDDNWGNIRKLPKLNEAPRKGGYGIYYHFDYVGGPRNYKWINTNPIPRVWEQMHLAYEYNVKEIWIVNVGDIKPMEIPISFFLDYAWNPEKIDANDLQKFTEKWSAAQFGEQYAKEIADIISKYGKYNGRRKPELLDDKTYSFFYDEWGTTIKNYSSLVEKAEKINDALPAQFKNAFFQLVLHPVKASANLNEMYYNVALNKDAYQNKYESTNYYADQVKELYVKDSLLTITYHKLNNSKWNHMMSQTHIGYTYWQQPPFNKMPAIKYLPDSTKFNEEIIYIGAVPTADFPKNQNRNIFYEQWKHVSIEASHFTKAINSNGITWTVLPDLGRTGDAITTFPVTASLQKITNISPHLEFEIYTYSADSLKINSYFSPTLNFHHTETGLQYAISIDDDEPQIISINKEDNNVGVWNKWVADNIIIKTTKHKIINPGKHIVKYWMVNAGVVLQKLVIDFGDVKLSYLGPPETIVK